jgi:predicted CXXCH cytochrome family protein
MNARLPLLAATTAFLALSAAYVLGQPGPPPSVEPPSEEVPPTGCVTDACHANIKDHNAVHGPVAVNACNACHTLVSAEAHTYELTRQGDDMCTFCHDMEIDNAVIIHEPMTTGECTACHDPHGGTDVKLLTAESANDLCQQCHEDVIGEKRWVHGPVAAGACAACHAPHASQYPNLLAQEGVALCNSCHVSTKLQMENLRVVHDPVRTDCETCHFAHSSDHEMLLKEDSQELCLSCHETIAHIVDTATEQHAAVVTDRACLNCHDAHASDYGAILSDNPMQLCFECHDREIELEDGRVLADIESVIEEGTSLHGPISQDNCAACHEIHGGSHFRLLVQEYPPEFYAPFEQESYALCFSCHNPDIVRDERTDALTNFRNGDLNLHFLHVNRDRKGRTCRACHETHASNLANHVRESVPFGTGGWELPINFTKTEEGGSCAPGCHLPYDYNRVDPVSYDQPGAAGG